MWVFIKQFQPKYRYIFINPNYHEVLELFQDHFFIYWGKLRRYRGKVFDFGLIYEKPSVVMPQGEGGNGCHPEQSEGSMAGIDSSP